MSDHMLVEFSGQDADCRIEEFGGGITIGLRYEGCSLTLSVDHDGAWRLSDALARLTSRAAVSKARATREGPT